MSFVQPLDPNFCYHFLVRKKIKSLFIYFLASCVFMLPQLSVKFPALTDDGTDFLLVLKNNIFKLFHYETFLIERTWPLRLVFKKILSIFLGVDIWKHYFFNGVILTLIMYLLRRVLIKLKANKKFSTFTPLLILLLPAVVANLYRLGTAEHYQVVFLLLIFLTSNYFILMLLVVMVLLIKETSVFYLLPLLITFFLKKKYKKFAILSVPLIVFSVFQLIKFSTFPNSYISQFSFDLIQFKSVAFYSPITFILFIFQLAIFFFVYKSKKNKINAKNILQYLILLISFLTPFFFWDMGNYYYHLPIQILIFVLIIKFLYVFFMNGGYFKYITIIIFLFLLTWSGAISFNLAKEMNKDMLADSKLTEYVLTRNWEDYHVYGLISGWEQSLVLHNYFLYWKSNQPKVYLPDDQNLDVIRFGNISEIRQLTLSINKSFLSDNFDKKILISENIDNDDFISLDGYNPLCVQSFFGEECCKYFVVEF